jgi:hypothetical protein
MCKAWEVSPNRSICEMSGVWLNHMVLEDGQMYLYAIASLPLYRMIAPAVGEDRKVTRTKPKTKTKSKIHGLKKQMHGLQRH